MSEDHVPRHITRRKIVKGAAWSVPVVAAAVALPASVASPTCTPRTLRFSISDTSSAAGFHTDWQVPKGVKLLKVTVAGGAGGNVVYSVGRGSGGNGGLVTANVPVQGEEWLSIWVGQGGGAVNSWAPVSNPAIVGGGGYGNGGPSDPRVDLASGAPAVTTYMAPGGSGGGGSAILRGTAPLVVAGGGGGAGGNGGDAGTPLSIKEAGSPGGDANGAGQGKTIMDSDGSGSVTAPGGLVGGAAVAAGPIVPGARSAKCYPGLATTVPRDGAVGGGVWGVHPLGVYAVHSAAGGGGGGYAGGGSGARAALVPTSNSWFWTACGGGAGGTNFVDGDSGVVVETVSTWPLSTSSLVRQGGYVQIEYCEPGV